MTDRGQDKIVVFKRGDGTYDWHRKDPQGRVLYQSSQGYENFHDAWVMAVECHPQLPAGSFFDAAGHACSQHEPDAFDDHTDLPGDTDGEA